MSITLARRPFLAAALALALAGCAAGPALAPPPAPIVFVHGNGDTAALWQTTLWRFESNGWPANRLHAIDLPYPLARDNDGFAQEGRTSTTQHMEFLRAEVEKVLRATGAPQVILIGNSRGGNAIRNYIANGGGAKFVSHAILGGTPNHGVWQSVGFGPNSEFNGLGPFLKALNNQGAPGVEVTPGPQWMTVRSDANDKFAQPDLASIGMRGTASNVGVDGPELKGAKNVVVPGIDHRETSFGPQAFAAAWEFLTGKPPATTGFVPEDKVVLDGKVSGLGLDNDPARGAFATNLPLAGATVEVWAVDPATGARRGAAPLSRRTTEANGRWGPVVTDARTPLEFVIAAPGYATLHVYRAPFPRSSEIVHLRAARLADADKAAQAVVDFRRPRGYFGLPRDQIRLDGTSPPAGIPTGVATVAEARLRLADATARPIVGEFNGQRIVGRVWPTAENRIVQLELH
jgi:triacylglycerol lipase